MPAADQLFVERAAATGPRLHARQRRDRRLLPARGDGRRRRAVRLRQRRRPRRLSRAGRCARSGQTRRPPGSTPAATSRLFRNDLTIGADGRRSLRFTDVTERAGVGLRAYGMGAAVGDYDNDGDLDLFVTAFGPDTLYHNNGDGTFTDVTTAGGRQRRAAGARAPPSSTTTATASSISSSPTTSTSRSPPTSSAATRWARAITAARAPIVRCPIGCTATRATAGSRTSPRRPASARPTAPASASRPATTTATAGSISTSPTTRRRISSGSTGTTARSPTKGCSPDRR